MSKRTTGAVELASKLPGSVKKKIVQKAVLSKVSSLGKSAAQGSKAGSASGPSNQLVPLSPGVEKADEAKKAAKEARGEKGTCWTGPNEYLAGVLMRANYVSLRRHEVRVGGDGGELVGELQRLVHFEGTRPPVRHVLTCLQVMTYYPPVKDLVPELIELIGWEDRRVCRLAHYFLRGVGALPAEYYGAVIEALEREVVRRSPARRAAAVKTLARLFKRGDERRVSDFLKDVFKCIGGARVKDPNVIEHKKIAGVSIPLTRAKSKNKGARRNRGAVRDAEVEVDNPEASPKGLDDGTGGTIVTARGNAPFIKSRYGKFVVGHSVFSALRKLNRVSPDRVRVEAYYFDSGLKAVNPSSVRHTMALLEMRARISQKAVANYLVQRLPHRNPPADKKLSLEDLGAKIYFARLLGALAEDPDLASHIPKAVVKANRSENPETVSQAVKVFSEKARKAFKFLFNRERVDEVTNAVRRITPGLQEVVRSDNPLGVEFAEALVNLLRSPSNRVLIEALRGLMFRRWTTWFEAPIPLGAVYNSPELEDPDKFENTSSEDEKDSEDDVSDELSEADQDLETLEDDLENGDAKEATVVTSDPQERYLEDEVVTHEAKGFFQKLRERRAGRRKQRIESRAPFYLRKIGEGMVPALEVLLRRIYAAMLHDESVRRYAAANAAIALARAHIYGHTAEEHRTLRLAQKAYREKVKKGPFGASSKAAGITEAAVSVDAIEPQQHPLEPLVRILKELMKEDPSQYVQSRAAIALLFMLGAGAGRGPPEDNKGEGNEGEPVDNQYMLNNEWKDIAGDSVDAERQKSILVRYFKGYITREGAGTGIGFRLTSEFMDCMISEVLDAAPDLIESAVELAELWGMVHPTVGVSGRLGAVWEKVLGMGGGKAVGESIFRVMEVEPKKERLAAAAATFLRRRTLDLAVITVGSIHLVGTAVPEPLPRIIGVEMERYFSLLWHAALLGPSAECRILAVEALGGAAALAGDPFRICTYERLVELVELRGLGLKIPAEGVLLSLDALYYARERFGEARTANRIPRDGQVTARPWLELVWKLAAEASAAAQILLGMPPPPGWEPLGPEGSADVANAEQMFGNVRDRTDVTKLKDSSVALSAAPSGEEVPVLAIELPSVEYSGADTRRARKSRYSAPQGFKPKNYDRFAADSDEEPDSYDRSIRRRRSYNSYGSDDYDHRERRDSYDPGYYDEPESRSRSPSPPRAPAASSSIPLGSADSTKKKQEQDDFELALKLQQEEESRQSFRRPHLSAGGGFAPAAGKLLGSLKAGIKAGSKKFREAQSASRQENEAQGASSSNT